MTTRLIRHVGIAEIENGIFDDAVREGVRRKHSPIVGASVVM